MKPIHKHDCSHCIFLGSWYNNDLYLCIDEKHPCLSTLICRYGKDGNYSSGIEFCFSSVGLNVALRKAHEQGYIKGELRKCIYNRQIEWLNYLEHDKEYAKGISIRWKKRKRFVLT